MDRFYSIGEEVGVSVSKFSNAILGDEINAFRNCKTSIIIGDAGVKRNIKTGASEPHYYLEVVPDCTVAQSSLRKLHKPSALSIDELMVNVLAEEPLVIEEKKHEVA